MNDGRSHQQAAYGRDPYGDRYDPYDDPYAGDQLAGARADRGGPYDGAPVRRRGRRRWPRVLGALAVVLILIVVGGYFYLDSRLKRESVLVDYPGRVADTPGTNWLIVGSDSREGLSKDDRKRLATGAANGRRTDSMMLLHYGSGGTSLISLPRDSYVPIPGRGSNKLNAAFSFGGPKLLVQTVEKATGVHIDHYAEIGFGGFVGVVDAVGGVDICVKDDIKDRKAGLDLKAGCQTLDGGQALGYVRTRKYARADLERVEHQRQFFAALMKKATSPGTMFNPFRSVPLAMNATSNFLVDENDHLYDLIRMMWAMKGVSGGGGVTTTVPIGGSGSSVAAGAYITWDKAKATKLFDALKQDQPIPQDVITK
ncbi:transcriptional attenuator, LytR family [Actinomadura meyerae]|uniref:Transcriptional attenuator, LytR family n=1 Tax=Actinomadura meyerae TaxID=240840 RepID=A0A239HCX4_9ACTN|nr:LCP family protein [Actinomadura meyerae]SNS79237.1 transcriptional attenuator, LytR family [Actinomadura meyerae]